MLDLEFARNAQSLMKDVDSSLCETVKFEKFVTEVFDELATDQSWSALKETNLKLMSDIKPSKGAAIVATAKDEGVNVLEWLAHYRAVGFDHIFIYTNDNRDGSEAQSSPHFLLSKSNGLPLSSDECCSRVRRTVPSHPAAFEDKMHEFQRMSQSGQMGA